MTAHPSEYDDAMLGNIILHGECPECDGKFMAAPTYLEFLPQGVDPETGSILHA